MEEIKEGEGLSAYVRRVNEMNSKLSSISGVPASCLGNRNTKPAGINIIGSAEFIEKFMGGINEYKKNK